MLSSKLTLIHRVSLLLNTNTMTLEQFKESLSESTPPTSLNLLLKALWFDGRDNWEHAHAIVQDIHSADASWIHAYLHRKEGDLGNASYWYHRANRKLPTTSLHEEWSDLVETLLSA